MVLVDELEPADVAILDAALSAERIETRAEGGMAPPAAGPEHSLIRFDAARALSGVLLGAAVLAARSRVQKLIRNRRVVVNGSRT